MVVTPVTELRAPPKDEIIRAVRAERRRTLLLLRRLEHVGWHTPTALPGWRVREVAAHLLTTDRAAAIGTFLPMVFGSTDRIERWNERQVPPWATRPISDLLVGLDAWGRRFVRAISLLPAPIYRLPLPTAWGRGPASLLFQVRIYDEWIHRQDIRRALGMGDEEVDVAPAAEFLLRSIGLDTLRGLPSEGRLRISLTGVPVPEVAWDIQADRQGRARDFITAEARIECPAPAFIMAAAGRDSFHDLRATGTLLVEGDEALAETFLSGLRIV